MLRDSACLSMRLHEPTPFNSTCYVRHNLLHIMEQLQRNQRFVAALILVTVEAYVADGVTVAEHPGFAAESGCTHSPLSAGATSTSRKVVPLN